MFEQFYEQCHTRVA